MTASRPNRFEPDRIERRLAPLDALPRGLWLPTLVNNEGDPFARVAQVAAWQKRLLGGRSPFDGVGVADGGRPAADTGGGVAADAQQAFADVFVALGLPALCARQPAVVEQVLRTALWSFDRIARLCDHQPRDAAIREAAAGFAEQWTERADELREVLRLFESLDGVVDPARWSEIQGVLRSESWQRILDARRLIDTMPGLAALIDRLGRARPRSDEETERVLEAATGEGEHWVRRMRETVLPGTPIEIEGIRRSGDLSQVLPIEAAWASRRCEPDRARRLRRLFAARLAEQGLLTYQHRDHWVEPRWEREPGAVRVPRPRRQPRLEAGPIVVCVDTSQSMAGGPERVAKAIVLQVMRVAARERRGCFVYAFSGAGQVLEYELAADVGGLRGLADFVSASFAGGTDVVEALERALARIGSARWRQADLLIASDGEFGPPPATVAAVAAARGELGLRVQGILIGDRETLGLRAIVDDTFWVRDWRRYGGRHGQVEPPLHDRNLTALYFPGALARPDDRR